MQFVNVILFEQTLNIFRTYIEIKKLFFVNHNACIVESKDSTLNYNNIRGCLFLAGS